MKACRGRGVEGGAAVFRGVEGIGGWHMSLWRAFLRECAMWCVLRGQFARNCLNFVRFVLCVLAKVCFLCLSESLFLFSFQFLFLLCFLRRRRKMRFSVRRHGKKAAPMCRMHLLLLADLCLSLRLVFVFGGGRGGGVCPFLSCSCFSCGRTCVRVAACVVFCHSFFSAVSSFFTVVCLSVSKTLLMGAPSIRRDSIVG